jgi:O-antigen biosynthesis protein
VELGYRIDAPRVDLAALLDRRRFDVAWLSFWYLAGQYVPHVLPRSRSTRIVVDSVDVHFLRERREAEIQGQLAARAAELASRERQELAVYAQADAVVTVTDSDAAALRQRGIQTRLVTIPNVHPPVDAQTPPFDARRGLLFVGNFAHMPNIDAVRWFCAEVLPLVRRRLPDVPLHIVGASPPDEVKTLARDGVVVTGYVPEVAPYLDACRVSVAPLRYGAGMKGKIGDALARGVPVVTTSVGAEGMALVHGEHVLVADDPRSFAAAVVDLHSDRATWERLAAASRRHVQDQYGPDAVARTLRELLGVA